MAEFSKIITALGIDSTIWAQLGIFLFVFVVILNMVFKPYFKAFLERQNKTTGNQEKANEIYAQTRELEALYQRKLRGITADIKSIYDKSRSEAMAEHDKLQTEAREKAKTIVEKARSQIEIEYNKAREELIKQAPKLSNEMATHLLSSEVRS